MTEVKSASSFTLPEVMWPLIMKLPNTAVNFYYEVKSQTDLSSFWVCFLRVNVLLHTGIFLKIGCRAQRFVKWALHQDMLLQVNKTLYSKCNLPLQFKGIPFEKRQLTYSRFQHNILSRRSNYKRAVEEVLFKQSSVTIQRWSKTSSKNPRNWSRKKHDGIYC